MVQQTYDMYLQAYLCIFKMVAICTKFKEPKFFFLRETIPLLGFG